MRGFKRIGLYGIFIIYLLILTNLILFKSMPIEEMKNHFTFQAEVPFWLEHNVIPFKTILFYLFFADMNVMIRVENIVGNIIAFMPFGFLLPLLMKRNINFKSVVMATFCLSLLYELTQLIFSFGSFDVDDLILNTLGGALGYVTSNVKQYALIPFISMVKGLLLSIQSSPFLLFILCIFLLQ
ncbi:VanZ family protein [Virgibacillus soli]